MSAKAAAKAKQETAGTTPATSTPGGSATGDVETGRPTETTPLKGGYGHHVHGYYGKFFFKHVNQGFGEDYELSFRGAVFVTLTAIPFLFGSQYLSKVTGNYGSYAVLFFLFTYYKSFGEVVSFAYAGIFGTFLAVINIWFMFGIFPTGVTEAFEIHILVYGLLHGTVFVFLVTFLDFNSLTVVFALSTWVWYWMAFITPAEDTFAKGFHIDIMGTAASEFENAILGSGFAICAILCPRPVLAVDKARDRAVEMVASLRRTWNDLDKFFCAAESNTAKKDAVRRDMRDFNNMLLEFNAHVDNGYWECFGFGRRGKSLLLLEVLGKQLREMYDHLKSLCECLHTTSSFDDEHTRFMSEVKQTLSKAVDESTNLLSELVDIVNQGREKPEEMENTKTRYSNLLEMEKEIMKNFKAASKGSPKVSAEVMDERLYCMAVTGLCRSVSSFAKKILDDADKSNPIVEHRGPGTVFKYLTSVANPDVIFEKGHANFGIRSCLAICIAFMIGWRSPGVAFIKSSNASIASAVAVLITPFTGSALTKNMGRIQGLVLGTVLGQLIYAMFGWCTWWGYTMTIVCIFLWSLLTLFVYFHSSAQYAYVGCLMAIFGIQGMLGGCHEDVLKVNNGYYKIIDTVVAVCILTGIDMALSPDRASRLAFNKLMSQWRELAGIFEKLVNPNEPPRVRKGDLLGGLATAWDLGGEASQEPRFWRIPWKDTLFHEVVTSAFNIRACLISMEFFSKDPSGKNKTENFIKITRDPEFQAVAKMVLDQMRMIEEDLLPIFVHETGDRMKVKAEVKDTHYQQFQKKVKGFLTNVNSWIDQPGGFGGDTLESDPGTKVCLMVANLQAVSSELSKIRHRVLQER